MEEYRLSRHHSLEKLRMDVEVHYMHYYLTGPDVNASLSTPCRSKLHHLLTGLFYGFKWNDENERIVTEDDAKILEYCFKAQQEYSLWKKVMKEIKDNGPDAGKLVFLDQIKLLAIRDVMVGHER